ncbi:hypothetical protein RJ639_011962 [Escallonia herrerae]|uniref:Uncharacterized protein n=1 Tax=Escallonia herrerae TaxID=1293975 RepID=A0AA88VN88_9ASTE|nr:hypothetical protein RJ639_011962 [Escallonia herrerae]
MYLLVFSSRAFILPGGLLLTENANLENRHDDVKASNVAHENDLADESYWIVPLSISKFIAAGVGVSVPAKQLFRSLVLTLLVPLILGKVLRESLKGLADFADRNRKRLSLMSALLLALVPLIQVSRSRSLLLMVRPAVFLVAVVSGMRLTCSTQSASLTMPKT